MRCFLRINSSKIREELKKYVKLCKCTEFEDSEWLEYNSTDGRVHGIFPAEKDSLYIDIFGDKSNFKQKFLENNSNYIDCGKNVKLFIKLINIK